MSTSRATAAPAYATGSLSTPDARIVPLPPAQDVLTEVLRLGAQPLLAQAIEAAVADGIDRHQGCRDEHDRRLVVRNGHLPARTLTTGVGAVAIQPPRVWRLRVLRDYLAARSFHASALRRQIG